MSSAACRAVRRFVCRAGASETDAAVVASTSPARRSRASGSSATPRRRWHRGHRPQLGPRADRRRDHRGAYRGDRVRRRSRRARWSPGSCMTTRASRSWCARARRRASRTTCSPGTPRRSGRRGTLLVEADARPGVDREHLPGRAPNRFRHRCRPRPDSVPVSARQLVHRRSAAHPLRPSGPRAAMTTALPARRSVRDRPRNRPRRHGDGLPRRGLAPRAAGRAEARADGRRPRGRRRFSRRSGGAPSCRQRLAEACGMVPRVYEAGEHPPYYFIAMEYVRRGEPLRRHRRGGRCAGGGDAASRAALCRFLDAAHRFATSIDGRDFVSLVHGDLKPRNVRLSPTPATSRSSTSGSPRRCRSAARSRATISAACRTCRRSGSNRPR